MEKLKLDQFDLTVFKNPPIGFFEDLERAGMLDAQGAYQVIGMAQSVTFVYTALKSLDPTVQREQVKMIPQEEFTNLVTAINDQLRQVQTEADVSSLPSPSEKSSTSPIISEEPTGGPPMSSVG